MILCVRSRASAVRRQGSLSERMTHRSCFIYRWSSSCGSSSSRRLPSGAGVERKLKGLRRKEGGWLFCRQATSLVEQRKTAIVTEFQNGVQLLPPSFWYRRLRARPLSLILVLLLVIVLRFLPFFLPRTRPSLPSHETTTTGTISSFQKTPGLQKQEVDLVLQPEKRSLVYCNCYWDLLPQVDREEASREGLEGGKPCRSSSSSAVWSSSLGLLSAYSRTGLPEHHLFRGSEKSRFRGKSRLRSL